MLRERDDLAPRYATLTLRDTARPIEKGKDPIGQNAQLDDRRIRREQTANLRGRERAHERAAVLLRRRTRRHLEKRPGPSLLRERGGGLHVSLAGRQLDRLVEELFACLKESEPSARGLGQIVTLLFDEIDTCCELFPCLAGLVHLQVASPPTEPDLGQSLEIPTRLEKCLCLVERLQGLVEIRHELALRHLHLGGLARPQDGIRNRVTRLFCRLQETERFALVARGMRRARLTDQ